MSGKLLFKSTTHAYQLSGDTVTLVTDVDYPPVTVRGTAFLDGRFFVMTPDGLIYQSALEDPLTWSSLEFIGSAQDPSKGVCLARHLNYVVAMKAEAIGFYYDAANPTGSILSPVQNAEVKIGCASGDSVQAVNGTLAWISQTKNGFGRAVHAMVGTVPEKISTVAVEKILDADSLNAVKSWSAKVGSHVLYGLTLDATSIVYDFSSQQWSYFTYLTAGTPKTVTAVTAEGVATAAAHGFSDAGIIKLASCGGFDGWHVAGDISTNTFSTGKASTVFAGSGTATPYTETVFPAVSSVANLGHQYMQGATDGNLYEFSLSANTDVVGAIASRIRTPKMDDDTSKRKTISQIEVIGDKTTGVVALRQSDDDYATYNGVRHVQLSLNRSRIRRCGKFSRRSFELLHVSNDLLRLESLEIDVI